MRASSSRGIEKTLKMGGCKIKSNENAMTKRTQALALFDSAASYLQFRLLRKLKREAKKGGKL
jgi:hypothetical protein